jgi:hypothetical protein
MSSKYSIELLKESVTAIRQGKKRLAVALVKEAIAADKSEEMGKQTKEALDKSAEDLMLTREGFDGNIGQATDTDKDKIKKHLSTFIDNLDDVFSTIAKDDKCRGRAITAMNIIEDKAKTIENFFNNPEEKIEKITKKIHELAEIAEDNNTIFGDPDLAKDLESRMNKMLKSLSVLQDALKNID